MSLFSVLLTLHVAGGTSALVIGTIILCIKKGDKRHRLLGKLYFFTMITAALVSLPMAYLHPNYFLFIVGVFSSYMLVSGWRYLKIKSVEHVTTLDWIHTITMLLFAIGFIGFGLYNIVTGFNFGLVFLVFGAIGLLFVKGDFTNFKGNSKTKNVWLTAHFQRMMGSYIASVTAFLVVNNSYIPGIIAWLLPTLIIVPIIVFWTKKYEISK